MTVSAEALRELHRIHRQLSDLRDRIARGPKQVQAGQASVAQLQSDCEAAKQQWMQARKLSDEKQLQLKSREDRIADLQSKLNMCGSNREYQALKEQIAADEQANSVLSDEILEILERIDVLASEHEAADQARERARSELEKLQARVAEAQVNLHAELERVNQLLQHAEASLPADFKKDYQRIVDARGQEALAPIDGETCGCCYQMLTPNTMNDLLLGKPVFCKSCGALLYLPEDRTVT